MPAAERFFCTAFDSPSCFLTPSAVALRVSSSRGLGSDRARANLNESGTVSKGRKARAKVVDPYQRKVVPLRVIRRCPVRCIGLKKRTWHCETS